MYDAVDGVKNNYQQIQSTLFVNLKIFFKSKATFYFS